jgi:hypothetical protein
VRPRAEAVRPELELPRPLVIERTLPEDFPEAVLRFGERLVEAVVCDLRPAPLVEAAFLVFLRLDAARVPELALPEDDFWVEDCAALRREPERMPPTAAATARRLPVLFRRPVRPLVFVSPSSRASAVSRAIILLKLLFSPLAV